MSDLRGVLSLNEVFSLQKESEWESADNVWIFPDGGGPEFKFADGTVTPAPPATPLGKTKIHDYVRGRAFCISDHEGIGRAIVADPDPTSTVLAITSPEGVRVYNGDLDIFMEHSDILGDYGDSGYGKVGFGSTGYTFIPRPVGVGSTTWGFSVAIGEGKVAVGDRGVKTIEWGNPRDGETHPSDTVGKVYVWDLDGSNQTVITPATNQVGGQFGHSIGIGSSKIFIGAPAFSSNSVPSGQYGHLRQGTVFSFNLDGTGESRLDIPTSLIYHHQQSYNNGVFESNTAYFGHSLCVHRGQVFVGAPFAGQGSGYRTQGRVLQFDVSGTYKHMFYTFNFYNPYNYGESSRQDDEEVFGYSLAAADDEVTDATNSFNLFVGTPYFRHTSSSRGSGMIHRFRIDSNTGDFPPILREENNQGLPDWSNSHLYSDDVAWGISEYWARQGAHMAYNHKGEGICNMGDGYIELTTFNSSVRSWTQDGITYPATVSTHDYYSNAADTDILRMPVDLTIDNPYIVSNFAVVPDNVDHNFGNGTNAFTGNKCAISHDFYFYGTNSEAQGGGPFSGPSSNGGHLESYFSDGLGGSLKGYVILDQIYNDYEIDTNGEGRKVLREVKTIV